MGGSEAQARFKPRVTVTTFPDREFPARMKEVSTTADPTTRTFALTLTFEAPSDIAVLPGMTAKGSLEVPGGGDGSGFSIPARAVLEDQGNQPYVWRVGSDMTVEKVTVQVGELSGDQIEITSGLSTGDEIAVSGVHQLRAGMSVRRFED